MTSRQESTKQIKSTIVEEVRPTRNQLARLRRKKRTLAAQQNDTSGIVHPSRLKRLQKASKRMQKKAILRFKGGISVAKAAQTRVDWSKFTEETLDNDLVSRAKTQASASLRESEAQFDRAIDTLEFAAELCGNKIAVPNKKELYNHTVIRKEGLIKRLT